LGGGKEGKGQGGGGREGGAETCLYGEVRLTEPCLAYRQEDGWVPKQSPYREGKSSDLLYR
jgi:hypothetical protein